MTWTIQNETKPFNNGFDRQIDEAKLQLTTHFNAHIHPCWQIISLKGNTFRQIYRNKHIIHFTVGNRTKREHFQTYRIA